MAEHKGGVAAGCMVLIVLTAFVSFCSSREDKPPAAKVPANSVDARFLATDRGLQQAHDLNVTGDGFREIILMKHSGCWNTISATATAAHEYTVVCSADAPEGKLNFTKFMVDTDTGDSVQIGGD